MSKANLGKLNKKTFSLFLFLSLLIIQLNAQIVPHNTNWKLTAKPYLGLTFGTINETLYSNIEPDKRNSLLEWNMMPLYNFGLDLTASHKNFTWDINFSSALPVNSGNMYDSDWVLDGTKVVYSINEEIAETNIQANTGFSYNADINSWFSIAPETTIQYNYNSFHTQNGYGWYGINPNKPEEWETNHEAWDSDRGQKNKATNLKPIYYYQHSLFIFEGINLNFKITDNFYVNFNPAISIFTYNFSRDNHKKKNNESFYDYAIQYAFFNAFKADLKVNCDINKILTLTTSVNGLYQMETKGDRYFQYEIWDSPIETDYKKGSSQWMVSISTGCKIRLF